MKVLKFFKSMIEKANSKGSYSLEEAHTGLESYDDIISNFTKKSTHSQDHLNNCLNTLVNLLQKGQSKGSYSLEEASRIFLIFKEINQNGLHIKPETDTGLQNENTIKETQNNNIIHDVSDLTEPLPLSD